MSKPTNWGAAIAAEAARTRKAAADKLAAQCAALASCTPKEIDAITFALEQALAQKGLFADVGATTSVLLKLGASLEK